MNINLTTKCNNHCPYCFQENRTKLNEQITLETYKTLIEYGKKSFLNGEKLALLGGEPTLYPELIPAIKYFEKRFPNTITQIITNLLGNQENINYLSKNKKLSLLVNLTYDQDKENIFMKNLKKFKNHTKCTLSITLMDNYEINTKYIERLKKICLEHKNFPIIRVGLMTPKPSKSYYDIYSYDKEILLLIESLKNTNIQVLFFDCPINYCQISQKTVEILRKQDRYAIWNLRSEKCKPVNDINPDLSSQYCSSYNGDDFKIKDIFKYKDSTKITEHYINKNERYVVKNKKCRNCELFKQKKCFPCHAFDQALIRGELEQIKKEKEMKH